MDSFYAILGKYAISSGSFRLLCTMYSVARDYTKYVYEMELD